MTNLKGFGRKRYGPIEVISRTLSGGGGDLAEVRTEVATATHTRSVCFACVLARESLKKPCCIVLKWGKFIVLSFWRAWGLRWEALLTCLVFHFCHFVPFESAGLGMSILRVLVTLLLRA